MAAGHGVRKDGGIFDVIGTDRNRSAANPRVPAVRQLAVIEVRQAGGPYEPHSGGQYMYSQIADGSDKRPTGEMAARAGGNAATPPPTPATNVDEPIQQPTIHVRDQARHDRQYAFRIRLGSADAAGSLPEAGRPEAHLCPAS